MQHRYIKLAAAALVLLVALQSAVAANDPGHDILYVEQTGNSSLTGNLNISDQLRVANLFYSSYLDILGNGSNPGNSRAQIYATSGNNLYIDAPGNLYLDANAGSMVYVGTANTDLNVSRDLYVGGAITRGGVAVCLANGTNCPSLISGANITGSGSANQVAYWTSDSNIGYVSGTSGAVYYSGSSLTTGTLPVASGGTGGIDALSARGNLSAAFAGSSLACTAGNHIANFTLTNAGVNITCTADSSAGNSTVEVRNAINNSGGTTGYNINISGKAATAGVADSATNGLTTSSTWTGGDLSGTGLAPQVVSNSLLLDAANITAGTLAVLRGGTGVSTSTGTGNVVLSAAPTLTGVVTITGNISMPTQFYIGNGAQASGTNSIALGSGANAANTDAIAIGRTATATLANSLVVGASAVNLNTYHWGTLGTNVSSSSTTPQLWVEQASTGDAAAQFTVSGRAYAVGIDNSDADKFKISTAATTSGAALGTGDLVTVDVSGNVGVAGSINISTASSCLYLPSGGKVCGNTSCTWMVSPSGLTTVQACN